MPPLRDCAAQNSAEAVCRFQEKADHIPVLEGNRGTLRGDIEVFAAELEADLFGDTKVGRHETVEAITAASKPRYRQAAGPPANRPVGIPTVADRVAQEVARRCLKLILEPAFHASLL